MPEGYNKTLRPKLAMDSNTKEPDTVWMSTHIDDIFELTSSGIMTMNFVMTQTWTDYRLVKEERYKDFRRVGLELDKIWIPRGEFDNLFDIESETYDLFLAGDSRVVYIKYLNFEIK